VRRIEKGLMPVPDMTTRNPLSIAVNNAIDRAYPGIDKNEFATRHAVFQDVAKGDTAKNLKAINTALEHTAKLMPMAEDLNNTRVPLWNSIANPVTRQFSGNFEAREKAFNDQSQLAATEIAKAIKGGTPALGEIEEMQRNLSSAGSPEALRTVIKNKVEALKARLSAIQDQYTRATGATRLPFDPLSSESKKFLQQIEGVNTKTGQSNASVPAIAPAYDVTATGPGGHKIGRMNDKWYDVQTGQPVQ
jgi:hypothetical protein